MSDELRERLAATQHDIWAHWMAYLLGTKGTPTDNGGIILSAADVHHWQRQITTGYADLTEREKDSDREQVDKFWDDVDLTARNKQLRQWASNVRTLARHAITSPNAIDAAAEMADAMDRMAGPS